MSYFSSFIRIPEEWTRVGRVDPTEELELTFALKQQNVDLLEETLRLVSDPDSAQYGRRLITLSSSNLKNLGSKKISIHSFIFLILSFDNVQHITGK